MSENPMLEGNRKASDHKNYDPPAWLARLIVWWKEIVKTKDADLIVLSFLTIGFAILLAISVR